MERGRAVRDGDGVRDAAGTSDELLELLFAHQTSPELRFAARWQVGDVLMWDNMRTIHNAVADYRADEPRLIKRCQVMATRFFKEAA